MSSLVLFLLFVITTIPIMSFGRHIPKQPPSTATFDLLILGQDKFAQQQSRSMQRQVIRLDSPIPYIMTMKRQGKSLLLVQGNDRDKRSYPNEWTQEEMDKFVKWKKMKKRLTRIMLRQQEEEDQKKKRMEMMKDQSEKMEKEGNDRKEKKRQEKEDKRITTLTTSALMTEREDKEGRVKGEVSGRRPKGRMGVFLEASARDVFDRIHSKARDSQEDQADFMYRLQPVTTVSSSCCTTSSPLIPDSDTGSDHHPNNNHQLRHPNHSSSHLADQDDPLSREEDEGNKDRMKKPLDKEEEKVGIKLLLLSRHKRFLSTVSLGFELPSLLIKLLSLFVPK